MEPPMDADKRRFQGSRPVKTAEMEPPMDAERRRLDGLTERIIGCAYVVRSSLGSGFLEKVYEKRFVSRIEEVRPCGRATEGDRSAV